MLLQIGDDYYREKIRSKQKQTTSPSLKPKNKSPKVSNRLYTQNYYQKKNQLWHHNKDLIYEELAHAKNFQVTNPKSIEINNTNIQKPIYVRKTQQKIIKQLENNKRIWKQQIENHKIVQRQANIREQTKPVTQQLINKRLQQYRANQQKKQTKICQLRKKALIQQMGQIQNKPRLSYMTHKIFESKLSLKKLPKNIIQRFEYYQQIQKEEMKNKLQQYAQQYTPFKLKKKKNQGQNYSKSPSNRGRTPTDCKHLLSKTMRIQKSKL